MLPSGNGLPDARLQHDVSGYGRGVRTLYDHFPERMVQEVEQPDGVVVAAVPLPPRTDARFKVLQRAGHKAQDFRRLHGYTASPIRRYGNRGTGTNDMVRSRVTGSTLTKGCFSTASSRAWTTASGTSTSLSRSMR